MRFSAMLGQIARSIPLRIAMFVCVLALAAVPVARGQVQTPTFPVTVTVDQCGWLDSGNGVPVPISAGNYRLTYVSGAWDFYGGGAAGVPPWLTTVVVFGTDGVPLTSVGIGSYTASALWGVFNTPEEAEAATLNSPLKSEKFTRVFAEVSGCSSGSDRWVS